MANPSAVAIQIPADESNRMARLSSRPEAIAAGSRQTTISQSSLMMDRTLSCTENIVKLLPNGTLLAFQTLSSSFTNRGKCYVTNKYLTAILLYVCVVSCLFFSFTDSFIGRNGKQYYGMATLKGFYVFNYDRHVDGEETMVFKDLKRYKAKLLDYVHAFFSSIIFLTVAFSDTGVQSCFFSGKGRDVRQLLVNLPLGAAFFSGLVFIVFPSTRKGIGYTGILSHSH